MKRTVSLLLALALLCGCVSLFASCSDGATLRKITPTAEETRVVGTAGDYEIFYDELRCVTLNYRELMELKYGKGIWDKPETAELYREELTNYVIGALSVNSAALTTAAKYGITPDNASVKDFVSFQLENLAGELTELIKLDHTEEDFAPSSSTLNDYYVQFLKENYLSDRYNRFVMGVDGCIDALRVKLLSDGALPSDDESVKAYVNENFVHVFHVWLPFDEYADANAAKQDAELVSWMLKTNLLIESNRAQLREKLNITNTNVDSSLVRLYNRLIEAISTDDKVNVLIGSVYNKDTSISKYGYYFSHGEYSKSYEDAAYALGEGEISDPVADDSGYYVIYRLPLDQTYVNKNLDVLKSQYESAYINGLVEAEQQNIHFSFNDFGKSIDLTTIK